METGEIKSPAGRDLPRVEKTIMREAKGRGAGAIMTIVGVLAIPASLFWLIYSLSERIDGAWALFFIFLAIGIVLISIGTYIRKKARHVAWTQESIERDRVASGQEILCPKCRTWNLKDANFCVNCALPFKIKCTKCGAFTYRDSKFCPSCGTPMLGTEAEEKG